MYTLPFYTESDGLKVLASQWSSEPTFRFQATSSKRSFQLDVYRRNSPVVVVGISEWMLSQRVVEQLSTELRQEHSKIVALVPSTEEALLVNSLNQGADRVVSVTVCSAAIFQALIRSLLPKSSSSGSHAPYHFNRQTHTVSFGQQYFRLPRLGFELTHYLFSHQGAMVSKPQLLRDLWGLDAKRCKTRRVETHASTIKKQLQLDGTYGWTLRSSRGRGYGVYRVKPEFSHSPGDSNFEIPEHDTTLTHRSPDYRLGKPTSHNAR